MKPVDFIPQKFIGLKSSLTQTGEIFGYDTWVHPVSEYKLLKDAPAHEENGDVQLKCTIISLGTH
jgi:hypothetical protein